VKKQQDKTNQVIKESAKDQTIIMNEIHTATEIAKQLGKSAKNTEKEIERQYMTYVSFRVGKEEYALRIFSVKEILKNEEITFIPHAPSNILGIIQLRGKIIPVIDLKKRLGISDTVYDSTAKIVVCFIEEQFVGLKVDTVSRVLKIYEDELESPPDKILHEKKNTVKFIAHSGKNVVIILDETKINLLEFKN